MLMALHTVAHNHQVKHVRGGVQLQELPKVGLGVVVADAYM